MIRISGHPIATMSYSLYPVSYTHLDVYKRQLLAYVISSETSERSDQKSREQREEK